jgi:hypothetical protein
MLALIAAFLKGIAFISGFFATYSGWRLIQKGRQSMQAQDDREAANDAVQANQTAVATDKLDNTQLDDRLRQLNGN